MSVSKLEQLINELGTSPPPISAHAVEFAQACLELCELEFRIKRFTRELADDNLFDTRMTLEAFRDGRITVNQARARFGLPSLGARGNHKLKPEP